MRIAVTPNMPTVKNDLLHAIAGAIGGPEREALQSASEVVQALDDAGFAICERSEPVQVAGGGKVYMHDSNNQIAFDVHKGFVSYGVAGNVFLYSWREAMDVGAAMLTASTDALEAKSDRAA